MQPAAQWPVAEASPSGIAIVDDVVYMAALRGARVWQITIQGDGTGEPTAAFEEQYGWLRNLEQGRQWEPRTRRRPDPARHLFVTLHRPRPARLAVNAATTWCQLRFDTLSDPDTPWRRSI